MLLTIMLFQIMVFMGQDIQWYINLRILSRWCCVILVALMGYSIIQILRKRKPLHICVLLDGIGVIYSLLYYQRYSGSLASVDINVLHICVMVPYLVFVLLSSLLWHYTKTENDFFDKISCLLDKSWPYFHKIIFIGLTLFIGTFGCLGIYLLFALEQYLLSVWAFLSCGLSFGLLMSIKNRK